jgi:myo-inositol 2-dehydrogenase/D-chiro-inositol 1-dehydrogenase
MGRTHLRALKQSHDVKVVAVCEPIDDLRNDAVSSYGLKGFSTLDELLDDEELDGALVVTPSDTHVDVIARIAEAGLAVLCEKPCGVSPEDTQRASDVVAQHHVPLQIAYWRRFVPELQVLRERILNGDFGDVLSISCLQWDGAPPSPAFRARSGGIFVDMGVHEFDQARWLTSGNFTSLTALSTSHVSDPDAGGDPDSAQVLGLLDVGATALVSLGRFYAGGDMASVEIFGTKDHFFRVFLDPDEGETAQLDALRRQASSFADYVRGGPRMGASVLDALAALEAATTSAHQVTLASQF